jgi:hypothetical protein
MDDDTNTSESPPGRLLRFVRWLRGLVFEKPDFDLDNNPPKTSSGRYTREQSDRYGALF